MARAEPDENFEPRNLPAPENRRRRKSVGAAATLVDVARQAGVSLATASTVLNNPRSNTRVSDATRERIQQAARDLRYHPNAHARSLLGGKTATLGVLFGLERASVAVANPYAFTVFQGIVAGAAEVGQNVTLYTDPWHGAERSAASFRDRRTDGVVVIAATLGSDILPSLTELGVPVVAVGTTGSEEGPAPAVDVDNAAGARLATEHLLALGHTRIAHLSGDAVLFNSILREQAFRATLQENGIAVPPEYVVPGLYSSESGYERAMHLFDLSESPTAIFAANDDIARGVLRAARDRSIAVPAQLSVIGFDGLLATPQSTPLLTTIQQPLTEIGQEAARLLLRRINGEALPLTPVLFAPTLALHASTGPR